MFKKRTKHRILMVIGGILLAVVTFIATAVIRVNLAKPWPLFISRDGRFEALMPESPAHEVAPAPPPFTGKIHLYTTQANQIMYQIAFIDLDMKALEEVASAGGETFQPPVPMELASSLATQMNGRLHLEGTSGNFTILQKEGGAVMVQGFVRLSSNNRIYRVIIVGKGLRPGSTEAKLFLDSFKNRD